MEDNNKQYTVIPVTPGLTSSSPVLDETQRSQGNLPRHTSKSETELRFKLPPPSSCPISLLSRIRNYSRSTLIPGYIQLHSYFLVWLSEGCFVFLLANIEVAVLFLPFLISKAGARDVKPRSKVHFRWYILYSVWNEAGICLG